MRYKTIIELICDAADKDEAVNIAGDYLRGEEDSGVYMNCRAVSLRTHRFVKCSVTAIAVMFFITALLCPSIQPGNGMDACERVLMGFDPVHTVTPALKTGHDEGFKEEWEQKRNEAIIEYIKR